MQDPSRHVGMNSDGRSLKVQQADEDDVLVDYAPTTSTIVTSNEDTLR